MEAVTERTLALGTPRSTRACVAVLIGCLFAAMSCDSSVTTAGSVDRIVLTPTSATLQVGATLTLSATVLDAAGNAMRDRRVLWASENETVATVSQSGVVIALAAGEVRVAASSGGKSASAVVAVTARPISLVRITPGTATISVSGSLPLQAEALDASGAVVAGRPVVWTSSDESIAVVSASGIVAGLSAGSVTITATIDSRAGTAAITIAPQPVASVVITPRADTAFVGERAAFRATALDAQSNPLSDRFVLWSSDNPAVATVSSDGEVIALAVGSALIRATVEGKFAEATMSVRPVPVARVVVSPNQVALDPGQTSQLAVTLSDSSGNVLTGRNVAYATSDVQIASVSELGLIIAVAEGAATIQVSSEGKSATAAVTVNPVPVASIRITPNAVSLQPTQTKRLVAQALDAQGKPLANRTYAWSTDDASVATVNQSGDVTGVGSGSVAIRATSGGQTGSANVSVSNTPVAQIVISPKPIALNPGQTLQLSVQLSDSVGGPLSAAGRTVTWLSRDPTIASVSATGQVAGLTAGATQVLASTPGASGLLVDSVSVVTSVPVASVAVSPSSATVPVNSTTQLSAVAADSAGGTLTRTITWVSLAPTVASVSATGLVTATAGGSATIEARANGAGVNGVDVVGTATVNVTITAQVPVDKVVLTSPRGFIVPGDTMYLTVVLLDAQKNVLTGRAIAFSSSRTSRATVDAAGIVTGTSTSGNVDITATSEGQSDKVQLSTETPVATITVSGPTNSPLDNLLLPRGTKKYTATITDTAGNPISGCVIVVSNSDPNTLIVSQTSVTTNKSGDASVNVTGGQAGIATLTFTASRAGAIPPGAAGSNSPGASITIVVP